MRIDIAELLRRQEREPDQQLALTPPAAEGTRGQRLQRLQVGLFGLTAMVLLVGLANIIKTTAERTEAEMVAESVQVPEPALQAKPASDPLADAGVVPGMPTNNKPKDEQLLQQVPRTVAPDMAPQNMGDPSATPSTDLPTADLRGL